MKNIYIIGAGPGNIKNLTTQAQKLITESDCIIGHNRLLKEYKNTDKRLFESSSPRAIAEYISNAADCNDICVLVSGDTGFYSLTKSLHKALENVGRVQIICGISSIQYFCSVIHTSWDDALLISLHGRECNIVNKVMHNTKVILLTGGEYPPKRIIEQMCNAGLLDVNITVGENLSYEQECITKGSAEQLLNKAFTSLSVMMIENPSSKEHIFINDDEFIRGSIPMTKQEIRCLSINKLHLCKGDIVFDIGAGTGSVAVETALQIPEGSVFAIEKEEAAVALIEENKQKFSAFNLNIIKANAKEAIQGLPVPDKAFIGGSGGELCDILDNLYSKNPSVRIVLNAITLETLCEVTAYYKSKTQYLFEVVNVNVSYTRALGSYNLFTGQNPVYIITISRKD